jgi:hypothetical protein
MVVEIQYRHGETFAETMQAVYNAASIQGITEEQFDAVIHADDYGTFLELTLEHDAEENAEEMLESIADEMDETHEVINL